MSMRKISVICTIVFGLFFMVDLSGAKCICCEKINDYCCKTPNKEDVCCRNDGMFEVLSPSDREQCGNLSEFAPCGAGACQCGGRCWSGSHCQPCTSTCCHGATIISPFISPRPL